MAASGCVKCGGSNFAPGNLALGFLFAPVCVFHPESASASSMRKRTPMVKAAICLDCGSIELTGDPAATKAAIGADA
jgi:hypothetical protein